MADDRSESGAPSQATERGSERDLPDRSRRAPPPEEDEEDDRLDVKPSRRRQPADEEADSPDVKPSRSRRPDDDYDDGSDMKDSRSRRPKDDDDDPADVKPSRRRHPDDDQEDRSDAKPSRSRRPDDDDDERSDVKPSRRRQPDGEDDEPRMSGGRDGRDGRDERPRGDNGNEYADLDDEEREQKGRRSKDNEEKPQRSRDYGEESSDKGPPISFTSTGSHDRHAARQSDSSLRKEVVDMERRTWEDLKSSGRALEPFLAPECLMIFPGATILDAESQPSLREILDRSDMKPWTEYKMENVHVLRLGDEAASISYEVEARRKKERYDAMITSIWRRNGVGEWKMCMHQQTPINVV